MQTYRYMVMHLTNMHEHMHDARSIPNTPKPYPFVIIRGHPGPGPSSRASFANTKWRDKPFMARGDSL